jgi:hypothetical protein
MNEQVMAILKAITEATKNDELESVGAIVVQRLVYTADKPADMAEYLKQAIDDILSAME